MPTYVNRPNEVVTPQPYALDQCTAYSFVIEGDLARMQALVDQTFNAPRNAGPDDLQYRALSPHLLLVALQIGRLASALPPDSGHGWGKEVDIAYWIPVGAGKTVAGVFWLEQLYWFQPFIFVDNPWALLGGREVYGFPKQYCRTQMPDSPQTASSISMDTLVLDPYAPQTELAWQRLIQIEKLDAATATPAIGASAEDLLRHVLQFVHSPVLPTLQLLESLLKQMLEREAGSLFLKQFRDIAHADQACYQAITTAAIKVGKVHGFGLLPGQWQLTQTDYASQPLAQALGLNTPQTTALGVWMQFDSVMENGTTLWQAD